MKNLTKKAKKELLTAKGTCKKLYSDTIKEFANSTTIHPVTYSGSGRFISIRDMSFYIENSLNLLGYAFTTGNDSVRGGKSGYFIKISKTALNALKKLSNM